MVATGAEAKRCIATGRSRRSLSWVANGHEASLKERILLARAYCEGEAEVQLCRATRSLGSPDPVYPHQQTSFMLGRYKSARDGPEQAQQDLAIRSPRGHGRATSVEL